MEPTRASLLDALHGTGRAPTRARADRLPGGGGPARRVTLLTELDEGVPLHANVERAVAAAIARPR